MVILLQTYSHYFQTNMSHKSMQSVTSEGSDQLGIRQLFTEVGTYKGNMVAILHVNKPRVTLDKTDFKELKAVGIMRTFQNVIIA